MAFKFVAFFALLAVAAAAPQHYYEQPALIKSYQPAVVKQLVQPTYIKKVVEHEEPANYDFEYGVQDHHTGDVKTQHETAKDGAVSGYYTLIDADGYKRTVHYTADDVHGFQAEVQREPIHAHGEHKIVKTVQPVLVKKVIAQPIVQKYIAQPAVAVHAAPAQHYYAAPAAHHEQQYYSAPSHYHH